MPKFTRVRIDASGAEVTVAHVREGMTVLKDKPALDRNKRPLGPTYPEKAGEPARVPYIDWKKDALEAEVEARNDARGDEEPLIEVAPPGNKAELAAALDADDANRA